MRAISLAFALLCTYVLTSCSLLEEKEPGYPYDEALVRHVMDSVSRTDHGEMYADTYYEILYSHHGNDSTALKDTLYWVSRYGVNECADVLVSWLRDVEKQGLSRNTFCVDEIEADLSAMHKLHPDSCTQAEACNLMGRLEQRLSRAYIRYVYGQRYGYVQPRMVLSKMLGSTSPSACRFIFDLPVEEATDSLMLTAISKTESASAMKEFLEEIQPTDSLFYRLCTEYAKAQEENDTKKADLARLNIERMRWRYGHPADTGKYVMVNLPSFMLKAVDNAKRTSLWMDICCGSPQHKTPLLKSRINRLELNPYWNVPSSIIQNEVAPRHTGDAGYFARNRMVAIERGSGNIVSAASLTAEQWRSGKYSLRQDSGPGNSLGRMIYRFPNQFSVYLHHTNSPGAFQRSMRAVSHGCIRLKKPLDLASFLMDDPSDVYMDKIRVAIDKEPLTEEGRRYKANTDPKKYIKSHRYNPTIPVYLDYFTLYPDSTETFKAYDDVYGYDAPLLKELNKF